MASNKELFAGDFNQSQYVFKVSIKSYNNRSKKFTHNRNRSESIRCRRSCKELKSAV